MFEFNAAFKRLKEMETISEKKQMRFFKGLLEDKEFFEWLFNPPRNYENISVEIGKFYAELGKYKNLKLLRDAVWEMIEDDDDIDLSAPCFLHSITNTVIDSNQSLVKKLEDLRTSGELTTKEEHQRLDQIEKINKVIASIIKAKKKIVKRRAKQLSRECGLDRELCSKALYCLPSSGLITKYKVSTYLNNILNFLYSDIDSGNYDASEVDWKAYFKKLFGRDNVIEVATFILLEGVHRIDKLKSREVHMVWDDLTTFALREMDRAPDALRQQMLELYVKRIDKMFANQAYDLRVNLLKLDEGDFPNLTKTITRFADKISAIMKAKRPE